MSFPYINAYQQFFDSSGAPLVSGTIEFRNPTTNDLINSYPTADDADAQTNANDNPLTLNASGAAASGLYLEDGVKYKVILKNSAGATVKTDDDVRCPIYSKASIGANLYPRSSAETSAGITPTDYTFRPGDTQRYTNGLADAILVAADAAATDEEKDIYFSATEALGAGDEIVIPSSSATDLSTGTHGISVTGAGNAQIQYTGTGTAVTIGDGDNTIFNLHWDVMIHKTNQDWMDGTDTTSVGLKIVGMKSGSVVANIEGFNRGLYLHAKTQGTVHNDFKIQLINDCRIGICTDRDTPAGWNNDNTFRAGLVTYRSASITTAIANSTVTKHVELNHVSDNANLFLGISFELTAGSALPSGSRVWDIEGTYHRFIHCRIETSDEFTYYITWQTGAQFVEIEGGRIPTTVSTASYLEDSATQNTNSILGLNNTWSYGTNRRLKMGALQSTGSYSSAQYNPDSAYIANVTCGPNTDTHNNYVWATIGSGAATTAAITGTGRFCIGTTPNLNDGHFQFIDPGQSDFDWRLHMNTWGRQTTNNTPSTVNFDTVTILENSATFVELDIVARYDDGTKVWAQKRTGLISRNSSSNAVVETDTAVATHDPDTFTGTVAIQVTSSQLQILVTGVAATTIQWTGTIRWQGVTAAS